MMTPVERRQMKEAIREEIFTGRKSGDRFTARGIREALAAKGVIVEPHFMSAFIRHGLNRWFRKVGRDHHGHTYEIIRTPKNREEEEE